MPGISINAIGYTDTACAAQVIDNTIHKLRVDDLDASIVRKLGKIWPVFGAAAPNCGSERFAAKHSLAYATNGATALKAASGSLFRHAIWKNPAALVIRWRYRTNVQR
jgi:hypothetical protein